jgi:hypothetical protein
MLEINTSKIVNTVTFTVDKQSIAEAKKAADDLQRHFKSWRIRRFVSGSETTPTISTGKSG